LSSPELRLSRREILERYKERADRVDVMFRDRFDQYSREVRAATQSPDQAEVFGRFAVDWFRSLLDVVFDA
jgi:hypothetical protein